MLKYNRFFMESTLIVLLLFVVVLIVCLVKNRREGLSGYGVTSGLAFNDRMAYCQPGNESSGGAWSGGCFLPHKVII